MGKKKKQVSAIGRGIIKDRFGVGKRHRNSGGDSFLHTSELNDGYDWGRLNLQSVTEQSNLDEFLTTAELAGTEFAAEKLNVKVVDPRRYTGLLSAEEKEQVTQAQSKHKQLLRIPRRPPWDENTTPEQLELRERESFLDWRRQLANLQEVDHIILTPYEKNLDFWRQLWRVTERSDVVVQIVDARNPLLFRCEDLERYVTESSGEKVNLLLINKADYLTEKQREIWADYFTKHGVRVAFWSAVQESERLKKKEEEEKESDVDNKDKGEEMECSDPESKVKDIADLDIQDNSKDTQSDIQVNQSHTVTMETERHCGDMNTSNENKESVNSLTTDICSPSQQDVSDTGNVASSSSTITKSRSPDLNTDFHSFFSESDKHLLQSGNSDKGSKSEFVSTGTELSLRILNSTRIVSGIELLDLLRTLRQGPKVLGHVTTIGMVGYPNVGKSSTINAILQMKKVPVSATPGRTKHFQTLYVDSNLMLCDCPGLVFPSFVSTKADLIVNGILPIDQMRDHIPPVSLVCQHIPRLVLETTYGINIPLPEECDDPNLPPTAHDLLDAYGYMRGYMTANGQPDCPRSARYILKDYVNGRLLYCHPPPQVSRENFHPTPEQVIKHEKKNEKKTVDKPKALKLPQTKVDKEFFTKTQSRAHSKGIHGGSGHVRAEGLQQVSMETQGGPSREGSQQSLVGKPWKKHYNRGKKEKLRRVYSDLDK